VVQLASRVFAQPTRPCKTATLPTELAQGWPRVWVNSTARIGISSQTAGSACKSRVSPVDLTFRGAQEGGRGGGKYSVAAQRFMESTVRPLQPGRGSFVEEG
jgi:hypothetical protein